eukprot:2338862-Rhodomonas_salina.1
MLIFIILGGRGVGARLDPGIKHSAAISGVMGGTTMCTTECKCALSLTHSGTDVHIWAVH